MWCKKIQQTLSYVSVLNVTLRLLDAEMLVALHFCLIQKKKRQLFVLKLNLVPFPFYRKWHFILQSSNPHRS